METVLYEYHFNYLECLSLCIPFIVGIGFFFTAMDKGSDMSEKRAKGHKAYIAPKCLCWIVGIFTFILGAMFLAAHIIDYQYKKQLL